MSKSTLGENLEFWIAMQLAVEVPASVRWICKCKLQRMLLVVECKKGRKINLVKEQEELKNSRAYV